jgi:hypothetical protein
MTNPKIFLMLILSLAVLSCGREEKIQIPQKIVWPSDIPWWKANNLRVMQANLPAYEATLNPDSLVADLQHFSINTLIINAGGIMAFYPTKLQYHYTNPYMQPTMLRDVIEKCHNAGIRVIVRFDFSRAHKSIFDAHPDWFYISPKGEHIINDDMYAVSINAPYEQEWLFRIVDEVIESYPIDGIFINMPGYHTRNAYEGVYHGIDQNPYDQKAFAEFSGGLKLPREENPNDPVFRKYQEFKQHTINDLMRRLHDLVKSKNGQIAICTYMPDYVDIIRHESQTNTLPYWPYNASDNVSNTSTSFPDHIVSNASIQQISFRSRYNAIEPEEVTIRLYENIANGSGLDMSLMGDFHDYEDERNFEAFRTIYAHHKKFEAYYGNYTSPAEILVIAPGNWPGGEAAQEYRGIQLMLKEAHLQYDIIEAARIGDLRDAIRKYKLIIIPEIPSLSPNAIEALASACRQGTNLIATNRSFSGNPDALLDLFGAKADQVDHDGTGFYLSPVNKSVFRRFELQTLLFWKFNLGLYNFDEADTAWLPIYTPGRPGPPEKIGGHEPTGYYAMGVKNHPQSKAVLLPMNVGKLYYLHGYEQHKNIVLDAIDYVFPEAGEMVRTDAHPRVEVILQRFRLNIPENFEREDTDGMIVHLVNLTGFSGNTYFEPLTVRDVNFSIRCDFQPSRVWSMMNEKDLVFGWEDGAVHFTVPELEEYEGVVIEK